MMDLCLDGIILICRVINILLCKSEVIKLKEEEINEMEIRRITQMSDPLYEKALHLYGISFPAHEQREPLSQGQILQQDAYHFDVICDN